MIARNQNIPIRFSYTCADCEELHEDAGIITHVLQDSNFDCDELDRELPEESIYFVVVHRAVDADDEDELTTNVFTCDELDEAEAGIPVINEFGFTTGMRWVPLHSDEMRDYYNPRPTCVDCAASELLDPDNPLNRVALASYANHLNETEPGIEAMYLAPEGGEDDLVKLAEDGWEYVEPGQVEGEPMHFLPGHNPAGSVYIREDTD